MWIEMLLQVITNIKIYWWIINVWDTQWVDLKKKHWIETYEIKSVSLSWFDNKIFIKNSGYDGLAVGY